MDDPAPCYLAKDIGLITGPAAFSPGSVPHSWHLCLLGCSSSSLPSKLPPLVVRASVGVWTTSPDQSPGSGPFPRCCSRITACFPQCAFKLFVSYSQPLPPQTGFPGSRHHCSHFSSLASALHRHFALALLLAVTPVESTSLVHVASRRSDSLRPC